ncbi:MAG: glycosyltransferase [Thermosynechococcaceae cyanobacterium]
MTRVSIIIPILNEAAYLARMLRCLAVLEPPATEIIIVDGGSVDDTLNIAQVPEVTILSAPQPGRSLQMNLGAKAARGDILCFLHADTLVPDDLIAVIESGLSDSRVVCGAFISVMTGPGLWTFLVFLHLKLTHLRIALTVRSFLSEVVTLG